MKKFGGWAGRKCFMILALAVCLCMAGTTVWAKTSDDPASSKEDGEYVEIRSEWVDMGESMTSAPGSFRPSSSDGVTLRSGNYVRWIDRISLPSYARNFYNALAEASDNDGVADWLIDVTRGSRTSNGDYVVAVTSVWGQTNSLAALERETSEKFSQVSACARAAFDAFDRDHPEVFWLDGNTRAMSSVSYNRYTYAYQLTVYFALKTGGTSPFDVRAGEYQNANAVRADIQTRDAQVRAIAGSVAEMGIVEKIRGLNQWLTDNNDYNSNWDYFPDSAFECLSALTGSSGTAGPVCEGYARAFKVLCDTLGIPCVLVDGNAVNDGGSGPHMWNYVRVGADWYGVDVTWNDPGDYVRSNTDYLLVGSGTVIDGRQFIVSHPVSNRVSGNGIAFYNGPQLSGSKFDGTIRTASIGNCQISISPSSIAYDGTDKCPDVQVSYGTTLIKDVDYTLVFRNNRNVGTASVEIFGRGDYTGSVTRNFTIAKAGQTVNASFASAGVRVGKTGKIAASGVGSLTYRSADPAIATVNGSGIVTGVSVGTARITVTAAGSSNVQPGSAVISVKVTKPANGTKLTDKKTKNTYKVTSGTTVACTGTANKSASSVKIPSTVKLAGATYKVTSVANNAFKGNKKLKTVTIGNHVTGIGSCAFQNCTALTKVTIPAKVAKIGSKAFYGCKKLMSVTVKSQKLTTKNVGSQAFARAGSSNYKKVRVTVPKKKYAAYKTMLKAKGLSTKAKILRK